MLAHRNNIGVLRLILAAAVIISHAPQIIGGDRSYDPVMRLTGVMSLGALAVDGFFLLSGYLIAQSMMRSPSLMDFLIRRVLRIYPAFILAWLVSLYGLGSLLGLHPFAMGVMPLAHMLALDVPPSFTAPGMPRSELNGPMWTIAYEFRCYLLVALLGMAGLLRRRWIIAALFGAMLFAFVLSNLAAVQRELWQIWVGRLGHDRAYAELAMGSPFPTIRLTTVFLAGMCFYLYRERLTGALKGWQALLFAAAGLAILVRDPVFGEPGLVLFGAPALFWLAFRADLGALQRLNDRWDISYGVYLYGWPIAMALLFFWRDIPVFVLAAAALAGAALCGAASWFGLERRARDWAKLLTAKPVRAFANHAGATPAE